VESEDQPIALAYRHIFQPSTSIRLTILLSWLFPPFKYLPLGSTLELNRAKSTIRDAALSMIRRTQEQKKEGIDILSVMLQENEIAKEEGREGDMLSEEEMINHIMTFLAAGYISICEVELI
jgi:cytochrome P450